MEQKQLDELDESYFGEEFIDDDSFDDLEDTPRAEDREESDDDDDIVIKDLAAKSKTEKKIARKVKTTSQAVKMEKSNDLASGGNSFYKETKPAAEEKKESADSVTQKKKAVKESLKKEMKSSAVDVSPTVNPWESDSVKDSIKSASKSADKSEKTSESGLFAETSTWKAISAVVVVLLIFSIFTQGFNFLEDSQITTGAVAGEGAAAGKEITLAQAEKRVLDYVNRNLLRPPYVAELVSSLELNDVFKVSLSVSDQSVDSYLTKDGRYFFPQGFDISYALVVETDDDSDDINSDDVENEVITAPVEGTVEETTETILVNTEEEGGVAGGVAKEFTLTAKKWLFSPQELIVKSGDKVVLTIVPEGLDFTFAISELGVEKQVSDTTRVEFTASKRGEFEFSCSSCESWRGMTGTLLVK